MKRKYLQISLLVFIFIVLSMLVLWGVFAYSISRPYNADDDSTKLFVIESGEGIRDIAGNLEDEDLIRNKNAFVVYSVVERKVGSLQAGMYELSPSMDIREIASTISQGDVAETSIRVTIPEGFNEFQMADILYEENAIDNKEEFLGILEISTSQAYDLYGISFLDEIDAPSIRGMLFPDTYVFHEGTSKENLIAIFLSNFNEKTRDLRANTDDFYEIIIKASLLEKEVQTEEDMKLVAGVIENRLNSGMLLQLDAGVAYITGKQTGEITREDLEIDSPFNTYIHEGLPEEPIGNPGLKAINAAMNPTPNDYYYYISEPEEGRTIFAKTLEEHNRNIEEHLR